MRPRKKKALAIVFTGNFFHSWIPTGIVKQLSKNFSVTILPLNVDFPTELAGFLPVNCRILSRANEKTSRITTLLQDILLIIQRKKSKSFRFRIQRKLFGDIRICSKQVKLKDKIRLSLSRIVRMTLMLTFPGHKIMSFLPGINNILRKIVFLRFNYEKSNFLRFLPEKPDLIVIPSSGMEGKVYEILREARRERMPTILAIENWDNLTSKSVLLVKPSLITVMGPSSIHMARDVQGFQDSHIVSAGLPRHNLLRTSRKTSSSNNRTGVVKILYAGFSVPHNEVNVLNFLAKELDEDIEEGRVQLSYRPHPARQPRLGEEKELNPLIRMDTSSADAFENTQHLPIIDDHFLDSIRGYDIIIATPTTFSLEAMMMNRYVIIDGTNDEIHLTSAYISLNRYLHLEDLRRIHGLDIAQSRESLLNYVIQAVKLSSYNQQYDLSFMINQESRCFSTYIKEFAEKI